MDNPGIKNLGDRSPLTSALSDVVLTSQTDTSGVNQPYLAGLDDMGSAVFFVKFDYGGGDGAGTLIIDTTLNQGGDWIDILRFDFAQADRIAIASVSGVAPTAVATLAALVAEGKRDGCLGPSLRSRWSHTGAYAGNTSISVRAVVRGAGAGLNSADALTQYLDGLETSQAAILAKLSADPATQTTLAALLAKVIAAPSTEAKQDATNVLLSAIGLSVDGVEGALAAVLAKLSADPATQTTLAAVLSALGSPMQMSGGSVNHPFTGGGSDRKAVAVAGTAEAIAANTPAKMVTVVAETDNTGYVVVGYGNAVLALLASRKGVPLAAGESCQFLVSNLNQLYVDALVSGDGITFSYAT